MRRKLLQNAIEFVNLSISQGILCSIGVRLDKHSTDCFQNGNTLSIKDALFNSPNNFSKVMLGGTLVGDFRN